MKRYWLLFSQAVTVLLAAYFIVATLQPGWLRHGSTMSRAGIALLEAPSEPRTEFVPGSLAAAAQKAMPAVVSINTSKEVRSPHLNDPWFHFFFGDQIGTQQQTGLGSGVIVSPDGYILTNNHVVEGADQITVTLADSRIAEARIVGTDPETDLAVLKIELDKLPVIVLGNSDHAVVGDTVLAIGNPFGVGQTVTSGIISALGRSELGINTAIYSRSGGSMGIGFAIPVSTAKIVMDGLVKDGKVTRGWIGVEPNELSPELAETFGVAGANAGVIITGVLQGGPAARAGMLPGDVIVQVDEQRVRNVAEMMTAVASLQPGQRADFEILRNGQSMTLNIVPSERPAPRRMRQLR